VDETRIEMPTRLTGGQLGCAATPSVTTLPSSTWRRSVTPSPPHKRLRGFLRDCLLLLRIDNSSSVIIERHYYAMRAREPFRELLAFVQMFHSGYFRWQMSRLRFSSMLSPLVQRLPFHCQADC
jgi:hypothetical protein